MNVYKEQEVIDSVVLPLELQHSFKGHLLFLYNVYYLVLNVDAQSLSARAVRCSSISDSDNK